MMVITNVFDVMNFLMLYICICAGIKDILIKRILEHQAKVSEYHYIVHY